MTDKIVVITGASRGLGLSLAQEFSANGWKVIGTGRSEQPNDFPANAVYEQFDASDPKACATFWEAARNSYPNASFCLVNNAGSYVAANGGLTEAHPKDFAGQMQSVYFTSVYMTQALVQHVPTARIINIVSSSALLHDPAELAYGSAKDAQRHFFQALQETYKPEQYQITNLYPDYIATHEPNPAAIDPTDLASFVRQQAKNESTYYLRDVTMYPRQKEN